MATKGKKVEFYYTSQGTTTGVDSSALLFDGANLQILTHGKTFKGTDTNTWQAANTSQEGYIPKLVTGGGTIATQASEYVLTYKTGTDTTPTWKLLPVNAYKNDNDNTWQLASSSQEGYVPKSTANKILRANDSGVLYWGDDANDHYTSHLYIGESQGNTNTAVSGTAGGNNGPYLKLFDDSTFRNQIRINAGTGISVTSDTSGNLLITNTAPSSGTSTDVATKQTDNNDNADRPILLKNGTGTGEVTTGTLFADGVTVNPSTNSLSISGNLSVAGTASFSNNVTCSGTFNLTKSTDAEAGSNNSPALIIGGAATAQHIEIDNNEIISKSNGTSTGTLYLNYNGGEVNINGYSAIHAGNISSYINTPPSCFSFNNSDMKEASENLATTTSAHVMSLYRNGISIPYQMNDSNDGGILRVRGTSESNCILELATWDDSGGGETIQFNYYPTTSTVTPTYSVSVPKKSGTIALTNDIPSTISWSNVTSKPSVVCNGDSFMALNSGYQDDPVRVFCSYGKTGASYINIGYSPSYGNAGELMFYYGSSGSGDNYVNIGIYGKGLAQFKYNGDTTFSGSVYSNSDRRVKKNIQIIDKSSLNDLYNTSDKLLKKFTWKDSGKDSYGFIAQQLEQYIPEAINVNEKGIKSVSYDIAYAKLFAALINKMKEFEHRLNEQK